MLVLKTSPARVDPRFLLDPFEPAYLELYRSGAFDNRVEAGLKELEVSRPSVR